MNTGTWKTGRGRLGPLKPLLGAWASDPADQTAQMQVRCTRLFQPFGTDWISLEACWEMGARGQYRERAFFGGPASPDDGGSLRFYSFTNDGKRSEGRLCGGTDVHPAAIAFEAQMPAGLARMIYWPLEDGADGFYFAAESKVAKGWNRFLTQRFRPVPETPPPA